MKLGAGILLQPQVNAEINGPMTCDYCKRQRDQERRGVAKETWTWKHCECAEILADAPSNNQQQLDAIERDMAAVKAQLTEITDFLRTHAGFIKKNK